MVISLKHGFHSAKADGGDATLVQPSQWNAEHLLTVGAGVVVGHRMGSSGAIEELPIQVDATLQAMTPPTGTTAQRPATPTPGMLRFNSTTGRIELYQLGAWANAGDAVMGPGSIGTSVLADGSVTSAKIADGSIINQDLADGSVNINKIAQNAVDNWRLADWSVSTGKIQDSAVIYQKLQNFNGYGLLGNMRGSAGFPYEIGFDSIAPALRYGTAVGVNGQGAILVSGIPGYVSRITFGLIAVGAAANTVPGIYMWSNSMGLLQTYQGVTTTVGGNLSMGTNKHSNRIPLAAIQDSTGNGGRYIMNGSVTFNRINQTQWTYSGVISQTFGSGNFAAYGYTNQIAGFGQMSGNTQIPEGIYIDFAGGAGNGSQGVVGVLCD